MRNFIGGNKAAFLSKAVLRGFQTIAAVIAFSGTVASAADHVLVMTIGAYTNITQLEGVRFDEKNALELARALGYQTSNAQIYKEGQLAGDGIQRALATTLAQVKQGDRLFFYYSGHGASFPVQGGCAEALVPFDATSDTSRFVRTESLVRQIDKAREMLSDAFVFFDACHAGGHRELVVSSGKGATRGAREDIPNSSLLTSKSYIPRGGEQCLKVSNKSAFKNYADTGEPPSVTTTARGMSSSVKRNFTLVAAASENEEALDQRGKGGLATTALLQCAVQGVGSTRGTGVVNVNELKLCAQQIINQTVPKISTSHKAHNIEVYANSSKTLTNIPVLAAAESTPGLDEAARTINVFEQIAANSNPNLGFGVHITADKVPLNGRVRANYSSNSAGYVTIFYVGSSRTHIVPLVANLARPAAQNAELGELTIEAPVGANEFLFVHTSQPLQGVIEIMGDAKQGRKVDLSKRISQSLACAVEGTKRDAAFSATLLPNGSCQLRRDSSFKAAEVNTSPIAINTGYGAVLLSITGH